MSPPPALIDTDVLSALLRRDPVALAHARNYLSSYAHLTISAVTFYEILRGLKAKGATTQIAAFEAFCRANEVLPLTTEIAARAAEVYADLHQRGVLIGDADVLIAATAFVHGMVVTTNNQNHFQRIPSLPLTNWLT